MNHLCGLPHVSNGSSSHDDALDQYELETLASFRQRQRFYESAPALQDYYRFNEDDTLDNNYDEDYGEEKKDSPSQHPVFACEETNLISARVLTPTYEISHDKLHKSGWRPLDDCTLYRFGEIIAPLLQPARMYHYHLVVLPPLHPTRLLDPTMAYHQKMCHPNQLTRSSSCSFQLH